MWSRVLSSLWFGTYCTGTVLGAANVNIHVGHMLVFFYQTVQTFDMTLTVIALRNPFKAVTA